MWTHEGRQIAARRRRYPALSDGSPSPRSWYVSRTGECRCWQPGAHREQVPALSIQRDQRASASPPYPSLGNRRHDGRGFEPMTATCRIARRRARSVECAHMPVRIEAPRAWHPAMLQEIDCRVRRQSPGNTQDFAIPLLKHAPALGRTHRFANAPAAVAATRPSRNKNHHA